MKVRFVRPTEYEHEEDTKHLHSLKQLSLQIKYFMDSISVLIVIKNLFKVLHFIDNQYKRC